MRYVKCYPTYKRAREAFDAVTLNNRSFISRINHTELSFTLQGSDDYFIFAVVPVSINYEKLMGMDAQFDVEEVVKHAEGEISNFKECMQMRSERAKNKVDRLTGVWGRGCPPALGAGLR